VKLITSGVPKDNLDHSVKMIQKNVATSLARLPYDEGQSIEVRLDTTKFPMTVRITTKTPPTHLTLTYLRNETDDVAPTSAPWVDWIADAGSIRIRGITGLTAGKVYTVRFLAHA
jgi:hypothetical protein